MKGTEMNARDLPFVMEGTPWVRDQSGCLIGSLTDGWEGQFVMYYQDGEVRVLQTWLVRQREYRACACAECKPAGKAAR
jgi:hypothetical protein